MYNKINEFVTFYSRFLEIKINKLSEFFVILSPYFRHLMSSSKIRR
jgi:hypothetical protein